MPVRIKVTKKTKSSLVVDIHFAIPLLSHRTLAVLFLFIAIIGLGAAIYSVRDSINFYITSMQTEAPSNTRLIPLSYLSALQLDEKKKTIVAPVQKALPPIVFNGPRDRKEVALTFDADMTYGMQEMLASGEESTFYDDKLIQILTETDTKATLFLTGLWIETYPEESKALAANPLFELASHSYSHPSFSGDCYGLGEIPDSENEDQLGKTQDLLRKLTNKENKLFRFPGGCYSDTDLVSLKAFGLTAIQWDVEGRDGFNPDEENIRRNILDHVQNGSIIVMHMNGGENELYTATLMPEIIQTLHERGFTFVTVSELLKQNSLSPLPPVSLGAKVIIP